MINLFGVRRLRLRLVAPVATAPLDVTAHFADKGDTTYEQDSALTTASAGTVDVCPAPASGVRRAVNAIGVRNGDTAPAELSVLVDDGGTEYVVMTAELAPGETLGYTHAHGWYVNLVDGSQKNGTVQDLSGYLTISAALAGFQPLDSDLAALAALTTTAFGRGLLELADGAAGRGALGLGTAATHAVGDFDAVGTGAAAGAAAQAASQPLDVDLTAIAALVTTAYGRSTLTLADVTAGRAALGLGTAALAAVGDFDAAGSAAAALAAAEAASQPLDSDLTAIAALATTAFGRGLLTLADAAAMRLSAGLSHVDDTSDVNKPVSTAQAAADAASLTAARAYADGLVVGLLDDRGNYDASGNTFPAAGGSGPAGAVAKGDLWTVSVGGTLGGHAVTPGDVVRALADVPGQAGASWAIGEHDFGYVAENSANRNATGGYAGLTAFKLDVLNALGTVKSWFTTGATVARTYTLPDKDGTVAMTSDVTGTNSGVNTGDETGARVAALLHAAAAKPALVDADEVGGTDSAAGFGLIRTTWLNVWTYVKGKTDALYADLGAIPGSGLTMSTNKLLGRWSAATGAIQEVTISTGLALDAAGNLTSTVVGGATLGANAFTDKQTITPPANTGAVAVTGYSLTGAGATPLVSFSGTLNTTGATDVFKLSVTNTARGAGTNLFAIYGGVAGATNMFAIGENGVPNFGSATWDIPGGPWVVRSVGTWILQLSTTVFKVSSAANLAWTSGDAGAASTSGIGQNAAGVVEINNGTLGTFRDLKLRSLFSSVAVDAVSTDGAALATTTAATVGAQKFSPRTRWSGNGWATTPVASQAVDFIAEVQPVQGAANPSGLWVLSSQVNGGGYAARMTVDSASKVSLVNGVESFSITPSGGGFNTAIATSNQLTLTGGSGVAIVPALVDPGTQQLGLGKSGLRCGRDIGAAEIGFAGAQDTAVSGSWTIKGQTALAAAVTNITGGDVSLLPGSGASGSAGVASGGSVFLDGGLGFGAGVTGDVVVGNTRGRLIVKTSLLATATGGIGYGTGAGGAVAQNTSKANGVTLNAPVGAITMNNAALAAGASVSFTLTNSAIGANDYVGTHRKSGGTAGSYDVWTDSVAAGSCVIRVKNNTAGSLSEAVVLTFAVVKGAIS